MFFHILYILYSLHHTLSLQPLIAQYGQGLSNQRSPQQQLQLACDVKIVFNYLLEKGTNTGLLPTILSQKRLILLLLLEQQKINFIFHFKIEPS